MICKHCGKPIEGRICTICKCDNRLSYTSNELAVLLGIEQAEDEYKFGFDAGWEEGYRSALETMKGQLLLFFFAALGIAILLTLICSLVTAKIGYDRGYNRGLLNEIQKQSILDETQNSNLYYKDDETDCIEDYEEGLLTTPIPAPASTDVPYCPNGHPINDISSSVCEICGEELTFLHSPTSVIELYDSPTPETMNPGDSMIENNEELTAVYDSIIEAPEIIPLTTPEPSPDITSTPDPFYT